MILRSEPPAFTNLDPSFALTRTYKILRYTLRRMPCAHEACAWHQPQYLRACDKRMQSENESGAALVNLRIQQ